jgi:hypothetical protein
MAKNRRSKSGESPFGVLAGIGLAFALPLLAWADIGWVATRCEIDAGGSPSYYSQYDYSAQEAYYTGRTINEFPLCPLDIHSYVNFVR